MDLNDYIRTIRKRWRIIVAAILVITTRKVLDPVIKTLNLDTTAATLGTQITATVPLGTVLIEIAVTNTDPRLAAEVTDAAVIGGIAFDSEAIKRPLIVQPDQADGRERPEDPHHADQGDSVYVIGFGSAPPNPSELLGSAAMVETLRELEYRFVLPTKGADAYSHHRDGFAPKSPRQRAKERERTGS